MNMPLEDLYIEVWCSNPENHPRFIKKQNLSLHLQLLESETKVLWGRYIIAIFILNSMDLLSYLNHSYLRYKEK